MFAVGDKVTLRFYPPDWVFEVTGPGLTQHTYAVRYDSPTTIMFLPDVEEFDMFPWRPPFPAVPFSHTSASAPTTVSTSEIDFDIFDDELTQPICIVHKEGSTPVSLSEKAGEVWVICKNCGIAMRPATEKPTPVWKIPSNWPIKP